MKSTVYILLNVYNFLGAPIDNELLKKVIDAHDPNRTDSVDYSVFLTGKKFVNKVMITVVDKLTNCQIVQEIIKIN